MLGLQGGQHSCCIGAVKVSCGNEQVHGSGFQEDLSLRAVQSGQVLWQGVLESELGCPQTRMRANDLCSLCTHAIRCCVPACNSVNVVLKCAIKYASSCCTECIERHKIESEWVTFVLPRVLRE